MDQPDEETTVVRGDEAEIKEILGVFDAPAFARRGYELEHALIRLHQRLVRERAALFEMIHVRLRQWAAVATGPDDYHDAFAAPVAPLFELATAAPPIWASRPGPSRRRRAVAGDLSVSVARFNRRWLQFLDNLALDSLNRQITRYNLYYVLEKECVVGSARLAARHFVPQDPVTRESLLAEHPVLPLIELVG